MLVRRRWFLTLILALVALLAGGAFSVLENMTAAEEPALPQPQNIHARMVSGEIKLKWQPVDQATSYNIYRTEGEGKDIWIASTLQPGFTDSLVVAGSIYTYKVTAIFPKGEGPPAEIFVEASS